jgi:hypothetical protein
VTRVATKPACSKTVCWFPKQGTQQLGVIIPSDTRDFAVAAGVNHIGNRRFRIISSITLSYSLADDTRP